MNMNERAAEGERYAICARCGYSMTWKANKRLKVKMPCPRCNKEKVFGPVYVEDFEGFNISQVFDNAQRKAWKA